MLFSMLLNLSSFHLSISILVQTSTLYSMFDRHSHDFFKLEDHVNMLRFENTIFMERNWVLFVFTEHILYEFPQLDINTQHISWMQNWDFFFISMGGCLVLQH